MDPLPYLRAAYRLKGIAREGWRLRGLGEVGAIESVAAHAWGTAFLCLTFADAAGVEVGEALAIAVVHDLAEVETGDLPALLDEAARPVSPAAKAALERTAMQHLASLAPRRLTARALEAWDTYEDRASRAAVFVRDMNLVDMALQAWVYEEEQELPPGELDEFFASAERRLTLPLARELLTEVLAARARPRP